MAVASDTYFLFYDGETGCEGSLSLGTFCAYTYIAVCLIVKAKTHARPRERERGRERGDIYSGNNS